GKGGKPAFNVDAAHAYGGGEAILLAFCAEHGIELISVTVAAVKNAAGKGGGPGTDKDAVLEAAEERWGGLHLFPTYDAADAAFIGLAAMIGLGKAQDTPKAPKPPKRKGKKQDVVTESL